MENARSVTLFLLNNMKNVCHFKRLSWFYVKVIEHAWSVTLFLQKKHDKRVTLQAFLLILGETH